MVESFKSFALMEREGTKTPKVPGDCPKATSNITMSQSEKFKERWDVALRKVFGVVFSMSKHYLYDRQGDPRNEDPITICELDLMLQDFITKRGREFMKDVDEIKRGVAKPRGINKEKIPHNNLEFVITSRSCDINWVMVMKQDYKKDGTCVILPSTIMRKRGFKVNKGERIMVEGVEHNIQRVYEVD